jgi:hypothetical protein
MTMMRSTESAEDLCGLVETAYHRVATPRIHL